MKKFPCWIGVLGLGFMLTAGVPAHGDTWRQAMRATDADWQTAKNTYQQQMQRYYFAQYEQERAQERVSKNDAQRKTLEAQIQDNANLLQGPNLNDKTKSMLEKKKDDLARQLDNLNQQDQKDQADLNAAKTKAETLDPADIRQQLDQAAKIAYSNASANDKSNIKRGKKILSQATSDGASFATTNQLEANAMQMAKLDFENAHPSERVPQLPTAQSQVSQPQNDVASTSEMRDSCHAAMNQLVAMKDQISKDAIEKVKQSSGLDCENFEKDDLQKADALSESCESFKISEIAGAEGQLMGFTGASAHSIASSPDDNLAASMKKASAALRSDVKAKCETMSHAFKNQQKTDETKDATQDATCPPEQKSQALKAIAESVIRKNPKILNDMFDLSALKMANQVAGGSQNTLEDLIKQKEADIAKAGQDSRSEIQKIYEQYGMDNDLDKLDYFTQNGKTRLTNENASALLLLFSQNSSNPAGITEADAASVWAMEQVREATPHADIGTEKGNWMNFSTRVYLWANGGSDKKAKLSQSQMASRMDALNKEVDAELADAFKDLDPQIKKCLACQKGTTPTLDPNQMTTIKSMIAILAAHGDKNSKMNLSFAMKDGNIDVTVK